MITQEELRRLFSYSPTTGNFTRLISSGAGRGGVVAGALRPDGYIKITIDRKHYLAHRLAWLYVHGYLPEKTIDHKNMQRADNRIENLREATRSENYTNSGCRSHSKIGLKGVTTNGERWQAQIRKDGKRFYLGTYDTPQEAHHAYVEAAHRMYGEFARTA